MRHRPAALALILAAALGFTAASAQAEELYKCTDEKGAVAIQSEPCPKGSTQVWKREVVREPEPSPEELAARAELARAEAERAANQARLAELERQDAEARRADAARAAAGDATRRKSECRLAHEFNDQALAFPRLQLTERQKAVLKEWVVEQCRDPDAPQADT